MIRPESRAAYAGIVERLGDAGAEAIVLGCTEITLLIGSADVSLPAFDTTALQGEAAIAFAVGVDAPAERT